jgi:DNA-binding MarR family transcriptional regulator
MPDNARAARNAARLHALAIHLLRRVRTADAEAGLSAARLSALSVLVFGGGCTIGELATAEQVSPPTMTRLVAGLVAHGLVRRRRSSSDARVMMVAATAKGRRILEEGRDRRVVLVAELLTGLDFADLARVEVALDVLERTLSRHSRPPPPPPPL